MVRVGLLDSNLVYPDRPFRLYFNTEGDIVRFKVVAVVLNREPDGSFTTSEVVLLDDTLTRTDRSGEGVIRLGNVGTYYIGDICSFGSAFNVLVYDNSNNFIGRHVLRVLFVNSTPACLTNVRLLNRFSVPGGTRSFIRTTRAALAI